jgi:predicted ribosome quality control (RQC) complex YloA/Tae2 family protein
MYFLNKGKDYFIHTIMLPDFSMIRVPPELKRARKNSVTLFKDIEDKVVENIACIPNERCISIQFKTNWLLLIKMFGNQSNIVLLKDQIVTEIFKKNHAEDRKLVPSALEHTYSVNKIALQQTQGAFTKMLPTLGGLVKKHIENQGYWEMNPDHQWELIHKTLKYLEYPSYFIYRKNNRPILSLFKPQEQHQRFNEVIEALNEYFKEYTTYRSLVALQKDLLKGLERQKKRAIRNLEKITHRLTRLEHQTGYRELADLIMAHMHLIPNNAAEVELPDFLTGKAVRIKLKTTLSPQKNAERYYRKFKNQQKEVQILTQNKEKNQQILTNMEKHLTFIHDCDDPRKLRNYIKKYQLIPKASVRQPQSLFKEFQSQGFLIWIGRNAINNDLLSQKYAHKDDMWLHAKDVKGSHVVIKHIPGRPYPASVIEQAAKLAAYYSRRKNDTLCPVIYTPKKYVRKPKGAAAGQVVVEREKILLVTPEAISFSN